MNALKNKVQLIGNVGLDPEVKTLDGGKKVAHLRLVTNEKYKNSSGELVDEATWHNLVAWGKTADIIERYIFKGKEVEVEGKIVNRNYTDKNGEKRYNTEILVSEVMKKKKKKV